MHNLKSNLFVIEVVERDWIKMLMPVFNRGELGYILVQRSTYSNALQYPVLRCFVALELASSV